MLYFRTRYTIYCIVFQALLGVALVLLDFPTCPIFPSLVYNLDFNILESIFSQTVTSKL